MSPNTVGFDGNDDGCWRLESCQKADQTRLRVHLNEFEKQFLWIQHLEGIEERPLNGSRR